jgi:ubiquinone/menaquinone biosynthesis C-methylase UbiE
MLSLEKYYNDVLALQGNNPQSCARTRDTKESIPGEVRDKLFNIAAEIKSKFHELGSPLPPLLEGCTVLDLGCGTGRDTYLAAQLVGAQGKVIGVDPSAERLAVAQKYLDQEMKQFGYDKPNVEFIQGYPEDLSAIPDDSVDVVISNCVLNMSPDKPKVMSEVKRVLKDGGELYFTDVYADRRIPEKLATDPQWLAARLGGALYIEDFRRLSQASGFLDPRYLITFKTPLNAEEQAAFDDVSFATITSRLINTALTEDICESFGEKVTYLGTLPDFPDFFLFDKDIKFPTNEECDVCGNVTGTVGATRYKEVFKVSIDRSHHLGDMHGDHIVKVAPDYEGIIDEDDQPVQASCC